MPPPKKAAKKAPKKAAKKKPGHHHDKHHQSNEVRRAFEHLGRVAILRNSLKSPRAEAVAGLTTLAQQAINDGDSKNAADLLRASEHLSFAILAGGVAGEVRISAELKQSITEHFDELTRKADEHWKEEHPDMLAEIYQGARESAANALKTHAYHQALEFARAAEALAHVKRQDPLKLERANKNLQLKSA